MRNGLDYSEHYKAEETLQGEAEGAFSSLSFVRGKYIFTYFLFSCLSFVTGANICSLILLSHALLFFFFFFGGGGYFIDASLALL